jgi:hypothetical protein
MSFFSFGERGVDEGVREVCLLAPVSAHTEMTLHAQAPNVWVIVSLHLNWLHKGKIPGAKIFPLIY